MKLLTGWLLALLVPATVCPCRELMKDFGEPYTLQASSDDLEETEQGDEQVPTGITVCGICETAVSIEECKISFPTECSDVAHAWCHQLVMNLFKRLKARDANFTFEQLRQEYLGVVRGVMDRLGSQKHLDAYKLEEVEQAIHEALWETVPTYVRLLEEMPLR